MAALTLRLLRRRTSPVFTAFCDGALVLSVISALFPSRPWAGMTAALLSTLPGWLNIARRRRSAIRLFVPDPLAPDFTAFAKAFLASAAECATNGCGMVEWTLCPVCDATGAFVPYSIDLRPEKGDVVIGPSSNGHCVKTDILFRPRLPLPVEVGDIPVTLVLSPAKAHRQVLLAADYGFTLPWNRRGGNWLRDDLAKLWPALALATHAAFPNSAIATADRLAAIAILLVFATFACARRGREAPTHSVTDV